MASHAVNVTVHILADVLSQCVESSLGLFTQFN